ncbi:hypothetical protein HV423_14265, partial [Bacillus sporothermodurans]|nr:hypothetical protein [Heyndrickxia sporothermodurans]
MKKLLYVFLFLSLILAACSKDVSQSPNADKDKKQSTEVKQVEEKSENEYTAKEVRLSPYNCVKRKVIIMIRVTMFSTKKTINGGHDDDPNQYYYKL